MTVPRARRRPLLVVVVACCVGGRSRDDAAPIPTTRRRCRAGWRCRSTPSRRRSTAPASRVGPRPGRVTFYNTANGPRHLGVSVYSIMDGSGTARSSSPPTACSPLSRACWTQALTTAKGLTTSYWRGRPDQRAAGWSARRVAYNDRAEVPCVSQGATNWFATGFTRSSVRAPILSVYNPTATSAVFNASIYTARASRTPRPFRASRCPPTLSASSTSGPRSSTLPTSAWGSTVLRGSLDVVGVQDSHGTLSYEQGLSHVAGQRLVPDVTTVNKAVAQLSVIANPSVRDRRTSVSP